MALQRLTLRIPKGSPLTAAEADADLQYLEQLAVPAYSAIDAAIVGAYPVGIIVDSKVSGLRYRLKPSGTPTVDPITDTNEVHWEILSGGGSGSTTLTSTTFADAPAPQYTEDPTNAEILAQILAQGTAESGGLHRYTTPLGYEIFFDVYEDSTPALAIIRKDDDIREEPLQPPLPNNFRPSTNASSFDGSVVCVTSGGDPVEKYILNAAGTWEEFRAVTGAGGGGTGSVVEAARIITNSDSASAPAAPVRFESPTDAEVLAQYNAITPKSPSGSIHRYTTPTGNEINFKVLDAGGNAILLRLTDRVRLYDVTQLPNPDHFQLTPFPDVINVGGVGYEVIADGLGTGGQAWQFLGENYGGSGGGSSSSTTSNTQFNRHTLPGVAGQQTYALPHAPIPESVIVQISGSGNNIDFSVSGSNVILSLGLAALVQSTDTIVITYAY